MRAAHVRQMMLDATGPAAEEARAKAASWALAFAIWMLSLAAYSPGQREAAPLTFGSLDWVALMKVATRFVATGLLVLVLFRAPETDTKRRVFYRLIPFGLFALWCIVSALWSPLPAASLGHGGETLMLVALAAVVGMVAAQDGPLSRVLFHLSAAALAVSCLNIAFWALAGGSADGERPFGFMHPNLAAQSAGIGLLVVVVSFLVAGWRWTRLLLLPALLVEGWVLFMAQSRTANAATFLALLACLAFFARRRSMLLAAVLAAIVLTGYLTLDPQTAVFGHARTGLIGYFMRGQTVAQLATATGRTEMWAVGWSSFLESPLWGHGNWVMTRNGLVAAWGEYLWQTSHNVFLHVLTGTGLVGGLLLLWGLWRPARAARRSLFAPTAEHFTALFFATMLAWFLMVGMYELSLAGAVSPVSIAFFTSLGIAVGRLP
jgi:O-antigen ligase